MPRLDLDRIYTYHAPRADQLPRYLAIRAKAKELAELIQASTPDCRESSIAQTNLQLAVQMANAAIAINEKGEGE